MSPPPDLRLLQAMAGAVHGGAEAFFERLVIALHRTGLPQSVLIRPQGERATRLRDAGVMVTELPFGGMFDWRTRAGFRRAAQSFRPTHVLTWMNRATRWCPRLEGVPHLARLGGYYDLKYYRQCDLLIGNTPDLVRYLQANGWAAAQTAYLPNFAAPPRPGPLPAGLSRPDRPLLFAMGRLHPNKGFATLLAALHAVPDAVLWLAGEGPLEATLRQQAAVFGDRVRFLGWQEEISAFLGVADVFICPSRHEPLGNVILEAWAHGVPVVATASEGPRQLLRDGETGLLTPVDDAAALGAAINRMLADPALRQRCAAGGRTDYDTRFAEPAVVRQYVDLLTQTRHTS